MGAHAQTGLRWPELSHLTLLDVRKEIQYSGDSEIPATIQFLSNSGGGGGVGGVFRMCLATKILNYTFMNCLINVDKNL